MQNGATPLHLAAKYGHSELVRCLCAAGCDLEVVTEHGFTADEVATNSGHDDLAALIHQLRQVRKEPCTLSRGGSKDLCRWSFNVLRCSH